jgi:2-haloacid dehalogenase
MSRAVVFDVNETMLDLAALDPLFTAWFGDPSARNAWFTQTLHLAMTLAATREFRNFSEVGAAALAMTAERAAVQLPADAVPSLREAIRELPPHPDVQPALRTLRQAGFVTAALSNNPLPVIREQMRRGELDSLFNEIMSVDEAGALKPAPEVYQFALARLKLPAGAVWMVAAHGWDIAGAMRAGLRGAFVARPGHMADPFSPPHIVANDLVALAHAIVIAQQ